MCFEHCDPSVNWRLVLLGVLQKASRRKNNFICRGFRQHSPHTDLQWETDVGRGSHGRCVETQPPSISGCSSHFSSSCPCDLGLAQSEYKVRSSLVLRSVASKLQLSQITLLQDLQIAKQEWGQGERIQSADEPGFYVSFKKADLLVLNMSLLMWVI